MKLPLIEIVRSSHGLDYIIHVDALERAIAPGAPYAPDRAREVGLAARAAIVAELRELARALESGAAPFSGDHYGAIDRDLARGAAEREIDALAEQIKRLVSPGQAFVIEFRSGSYFRDLAADRGCAVDHAHRWSTRYEAEAFMRKHEWIIFNGGMVVEVAP